MFTKICRHFSFLIKIGPWEWTVYVKTYVIFCWHLHRDSLNTYLTEQSFFRTEVSGKNKIYFTFSAHTSVFKMCANAPELYIYTYLLTTFGRNYFLVKFKVLLPLRGW